MTENSSAQPLECPNCGAAVPGGLAECPQCGMDVFLLSDLLYRQRLEEALAQSPSTPASIEELVPRLGESLVEQHIITKDALQQALASQKEEAATGTIRRLGQILVAQGSISVEDLDRAIASMVARLQQALQKANHTLEDRVRARTNELTQALEKLSELNQLKANFISHISHELRTPMTHVVGYIDLMEDGTFGPLTSQQMDAVISIRRASQRLEDLIEDLIQYSDNSRGELSLNIQTIQLRECIQDAYSRMTSKALRGNVRLEIALPADLPTIRGDARRLTWVLSQLLDNGIKFTPADGTVELRVTVEDNREIISFTDTGIGIPSAQIQELFQPFHQLNGGLTRRYGGTGLGLSMCKMILDAHGSELTVQSQEGKGSRFQFALPVAKGTNPPPTSG
jgi:signal transduction histidine kinase